MALHWILAPFFDLQQGSAVIRGRYIVMRNVNITEACQKLLFSDLRNAFPMKLTKIQCNHLEIDVLTFTAIVSDLTLVVQPYSSDQSKPTTEAANPHVISLLNLIDKEESQLSENLKPTRWSIFSLTSDFLLPRIHIHRVYMIHSHLNRGVPKHPFGLNESLAEVLLFW